MRALTALFLALGLAACGGNNDDGTDDTAKRAQVRVVQAVIDAPVLDVFVSSTARLAAFAQQASLTTSGEVGLDQNSNYQFIARLPGSSDVLAQLDMHLEEGQRVLLVVSGAVTPQAGEQPITITSYDDARIDFGAGQTYVRVINAALDNGALTPIIAGDQVASIPAGGEATKVVEANTTVPVSAAGVAFTTPPLPSGTDVNLVALGNPNAPQNDARSFRFLVVPAVGPGNTTAASVVAPDPFAVFVNGVPGGVGQLEIDGAASAISVPFSTVSPRLQVSTGVVIDLDGVQASISGRLDPASTYLIVLARDPLTSGLTMFAYRDALADSTETRVRAINTTVGSGARDIAFNPAPLLGSDLVFGAASASTGTVIADPTSVTSITATPTTGSTFVYATGITAATRYVVLIGETAGQFGAVIIDANWSGTFVLSQP